MLSRAGDSRELCRSLRIRPIRPQYNLNNYYANVSRDLLDDAALARWKR